MPPQNFAIYHFPPGQKFLYELLPRYLANYEYDELSDNFLDFTDSNDHFS